MLSTPFQSTVRSQMVSGNDDNSLLKMFNDDFSRDIRYYDDELQIIAEEERIELESEKLDSSGL